MDKPLRVFGAGHKTAQGYIMIKVDGKQRPLHRIIMEEYLGRPLERHENVHHINGIRDDNGLENLELWSVQQPSGQRAIDKIKFAISILEQYKDTPLMKDEELWQT